jgi:ribosomal-protein-alanine N-acetyltransferase
MRVIETRRLTLRQLSLDDAEFILELVNEPAFIKNIGDKRVRNMADARQYILNGPLDSYQRFGFGLYLVELKESRLPVGICGLLKREVLDDVDIGYAFLERFWSKGYAFESTKAVMDYAKSIIGLHRVVALISPGNERSIKVLEKLGFQFEEALRLSGYDGDSLLYARNFPVVVEVG